MIALTMTTDALDENWRRISDRVPHMRLTQLLAIAVPPVAALALVLGVSGALLAAVVVVVAMGGSGGLTYAFLLARYRAWGYREREDDLLVRRGCLIRRVSVVPYGRMQFVDVIAGPFERSFGLATVRLHTAAAATDARIPGLDQAEATRLRDRLAALGEARAAGL
ncbi:MAG: transrane protein distant y with ydbS [Chloroflexi bacterium]|jgi:membrane protein YdbS with pleckstrin-like domain|nr:transrane protein distant y with ydbS [Chloroflexota bacterium]